MLTPKRKKEFDLAGGFSEKPTGAEPGATANGMACHGSCSEQHAPRQARSSLSLNVRQNYRNRFLIWKMADVGW